MRHLRALIFGVVAVLVLVTGAVLRPSQQMAHADGMGLFLQDTSLANFVRAGGDLSDICGADGHASDPVDGSCPHCSDCLPGGVTGVLLLLSPVWQAAYRQNMAAVRPLPQPHNRSAKPHLQPAVRAPPLAQV